MASALDDLLGAARAGVEARKAAALERALEIKQAADAYALAVEGDALGELARKVGVSVAQPAALRAREAAESLRKLVARLPELTAPERAPAASPGPM